MVAWGLGFVVTRIGAPATGELSLDQFLARHRSGPLSELSLLIEVLLGVSVAPMVLISVAALVTYVRHWVAAVLMVVVTGAGWVAGAIGKILVHRSRPPGDALHALVSETGMDSYPSGHTAFAAGLLASAVLIAYIYGRSPLRTAVAGLPGLLVVGLSRMYLGVHYIADVVGSCLVVAASTLLLIGTYNAGWRWLKRSPKPEVSPSVESVAVTGGVQGAGTVDVDHRAGPEEVEGSAHSVPVEAGSGHVATLLNMLGGEDADTGR